MRKIGITKWAAIAGVMHTEVDVSLFFCCVQREPEHTRIAQCKRKFHLRID